MNPILLPLTQAAAVPSSRTWFDNPAIQNKLGYAPAEPLAAPSAPRAPPTKHGRRQKRLQNQIAQSRPQRFGQT